MSVNTIRRGLEAEVQSNEAARSRIVDIQSHSQAVGTSHYDRTASLVVSSFMNMQANKGNYKDD